MVREFPVDGTTRKKNPAAAAPGIGIRRQLWMRFRGVLRLIAPRGSIQFHALLTTHFIARTVIADVHRFQESIAGQAYLIEVRAVDADRWRAYIVRMPGVPTALMPFYGRTPDEAARLLSDWLTRAHRQAGHSPGPV